MADHTVLCNIKASINALRERVDYLEDQISEKDDKINKLTLRVERMEPEKNKNKNEEGREESEEIKALTKREEKIKTEKRKNEGGAKSLK